MCTVNVHNFTSTEYYCHNSASANSLYYMAEISGWYSDGESA